MVTAMGHEDISLWEQSQIQRLAKNQTAAKKVRNLLDGMTLQRAATLPDEIKSWQCRRQPFGQKPDQSRTQAFVNANCSGSPKHSEFHYTDVPVIEMRNNTDGTGGLAQLTS